MAILSAAELKETREAIKAGVTSVSQADADRAIREAEALLNRSLGYKAFTDASEITVIAPLGDRLLLPERTRAISAVTDTFPGRSPSVVSDHYEVRSKGFVLLRPAGWVSNNTVTITGDFGFAADEDEFVLAQEFVIRAAVNELKKTEQKLGGISAPPGAYITGYQSEGAAFTYYTPDESGTITGSRELDILVERIGRHPSKRSSALWTLNAGDISGRSLGPEAIFLGIDEEPR